MPTSQDMAIFVLTTTTTTTTIRPIALLLAHPHRVIIEVANEHHFVHVCARVY